MKLSKIQKVFAVMFFVSLGLIAVISICKFNPYSFFDETDLLSPGEAPGTFVRNKILYFITTISFFSFLITTVIGCNKK